MVVFQDDKQEKKLSHLREREEEELAEILSKKYGIPYLDLTRTSINGDALRLLSAKEAESANVAIFGRVGKKIQVAVLAPEAPATKQMVAKLSEQGFEVSRFMVSHRSLARAWERYRELSYATESKAGVFDINPEELTALTAKVHSTTDVGPLIAEVMEMKRVYRISRILEIILAGAIGTDASDIHLEPEEKEVRLRYRLDGVLTNILQFDHETYNLLLSRIKLLSGLKLNIENEAQDGRFSIKIHDQEIEIRTSVLPGPYGESVVLRILNPNTITVPMEELGIEPKLLAILEREIKKPNGMILTTGPTGSGKTTTLYAFLRKIHSPDIKIVTIEDPIEYHLDGIVQTQVDKKSYTFAEGLRSTLRQDPDVIMVGEIRDEEVAQTAINASLTGHLVFSTLHTNNAAGTFPRLIDLGINPKVISSAITIAMAQRLVRKLCSACKKERAATATEQEIINRALATITVRADVPTKRGVVWDAQGCSACHDGYKGRIGVFEAILADERIEAALQKNPSEREIWKAAEPQGILTMPQDGMLKVLRGTTSLEELGRVVDLSA